MFVLSTHDILKPVHLVAIVHEHRVVHVKTMIAEDLDRHDIGDREGLTPSVCPPVRVQGDPYHARLLSEYQLRPA